MKLAMSGVLLLAALIVTSPLHAQTPPGVPLDYFPLKKGTTWTYTIKIGDTEPTAEEMPEWPMGKMVMGQITRSRFLPLIIGGGKRPSSFVLSYRVKDTAPSQGPFRWPGVKVQIVQDTLQYFHEAKEVFFNVASNSEVNLVTTYDGSRAPNPGMGWGQDGYSFRILFFGARPMTEKSIGEKSPDRLLYQGYGRVPGTPDYGLHFVRTVDPPKSLDSSRKKSVLDEGFTEDTWFVQGKGMVLLIQKHNGKVAMTWMLSTFSK